MANTIIKNSKVGRLSLPDFKTYYKTTVIKIALVLVKEQKIDQCKRTENPEVDPYEYSQLNKDNSMEKGTVLSTSSVGTSSNCVYPHAEK